MSPTSTDSGSQYIDANLYKAATVGNFEPFKNYAQSLDHLITGRNKNTILHLHLNSPCERSKDFVEKVLDQCPHLLWQINDDGNVPLHIAAKNGHHEIVKLLINEAKKPIHRDLETGEEEAVRRLLRSRNKQLESALHLASSRWRNSYNVTKEILEHEDPNYAYTPNKSGESPLYLATKASFEILDKFESPDYRDAAFEILDKFESPDCRGPNGTTVFHLLAKWYFLHDGYFDLLFSKLGSFVNQSDEKGWTPLHYAAYEGRLKVVQKILATDKSSAYATEKRRNRTPLHMAACRGNVYEMKKIIDKCPESCEITDVRGWNVLHYAIISSSEESVKMIIKDSSLAYLMHEQDIKGYTPLRLLLMKSGNFWPLFSWIISTESGDFAFQTMLSRDYLNADREDAQEWMKDLGGGPSGTNIVARKSWEEIENETAEKVIPNLEKAKESHLVAAALVATVTFAAAFTLPGGYISDENDSKLKGSPILSRNAAFKAFVVTDAIAMVLSTSSVFIHFVMVLLGYKLRYYWLIRSAFWFIVVAMGAMVVAFVTGTYAVLAPNSMELAIATCVIGLTFFVHVFYAFTRLIFNFIKRDRVENKGSTITESLRRLGHSAPQYLSFGCDWCN